MGKWGLRLVAVFYLSALLILPVSLVAKRTFENGAGPVWEALTTPAAVHAFQITAIVASFAVVLNTVFGVVVALLLVRGRLPFRRLLNALIDLPIAVSPVVVGLSLLLVYNGRDGWFGPALEDLGYKIVFSAPGMIMATVFVALPLVIREVVPVLQEIGDDQEQAARSLGANAYQTFRRITLPAIKWAIVYGVVLSLARSLGEFGAVKIVSGNIANQTQTATLVVEQQYQNFEQASAYAVAALLAFAAMACLVIVSILRPKDQS